MKDNKPHLLPKWVEVAIDAGAHVSLQDIARLREGRSLIEPDLDDYQTETVAYEAASDLQDPGRD